MVLARYLHCVSAARGSWHCSPLHGAAQRGGRYPGWAHDVAVGPAGRLRCGARPTRAAAVPLVSALNAPPLKAPRRSGTCGAGLPLAGLRSSPRHKSPTPGTAHRAEPLVVCHEGACHGGASKAAGGCAPAATLGGAEERRLRGRARAARAPTSDSSRLSERSERSERSEFRDGPRSRVPQGSRRAAPTAAHERRRIPARGFARSVAASNPS